MPDIRRELVTLLPRLRRFALSLCRDIDEAEDLVQTAVERALRNAESWQAGTRLDSWLYRIIQNLWRDELRAHRRRSESLDEVIEITGEDGRETVVRQIEWAEARATMQTLPDEQRIVLSLVVLDGLSYQRVAELTNVPIGTVMSRLSRARARMTEQLSGKPAAPKA